ncbi:ABC transporter permease [Micromonospora sp. BRA006-A]|nr:ABC transporter permease [Micromonospora sp. BRA006-A]
MTFPPSVPVAEKIAMALPLTIQLTALGVVGALVIALALGIPAALYRDRWPDQVIRIVSMAGIATPSFWLALLFIQEFSVRRPIFPTGGYVNPADSVGLWLQSLAMPALALAVPVGCSLARIVRTSMVEELDKDYVRTAIGAGLPPRVVIGRNVLRNALVNPLTALGLRIGYLIGGTVVIEAIFSLPGMGTQIMSAVQQNDTALAQGTVPTIALCFVLVNLVVDILYLFANPDCAEATDAPVPHHAAVPPRHGLRPARSRRPVRARLRRAHRRGRRARPAAAAPRPHPDRARTGADGPER